MLKYETIHEVAGARRRLKGHRYYQWKNDDNNAESDRLLLFTFETQALADGANNLDFLLAQARGYNQRYVILTDTKIQIAGEHDTEHVANAIAPREWQRDFSEWLDDTHGHARPVLQDTRYGSVGTLQTWRNCFCLREHQGVYDVATGRRMTNREEIIRAFWSLGFATWRGRPYSIAKLRWSGERDELEELADLARRYWSAQHRSEVAKKITSAYRSINRYAAWPGSW